MTSEDGRATDEAGIRALIEDRVKAIHAKDVDAAMSRHASDVVMFDVINPLRYIGSDKVRERSGEWFASYESPIGYEIRDLSVTAGEDLAFCHYLYRVSGTLKSGNKVDMWVRATTCCRKVDGRWMVAHEHQSVPFDPKTGKASLDLKP